MKLLTLTFLASTLLYMAGCAQSSIPNKEEQIASAVMALPDEERAEATVYGYDSQGKLVLLRQGSNEQICLADDPSKEGFQVVCYHQDLEPFMARGRQLRAEGKTPGEINEIREAEAKAGTLKMPEHPATLHVLAGKEGKYDPATGKVLNAHYRYVVYIPWATPESTGLPTKPMVPGGPWIMDPGTHKAHIMISPPKMPDQPE
ncbi:MAG: hypothetical protein D6730_03615 [Bacteroidetes bacterium]|nr:MAG: hypothetical protein D6730_03615 [Bacteroidota bacterium]